MEQHTGDATSPSRTARLSADVVRQRMLEAGLDVVRTRGLSDGLHALRMDDMIVAAGVPRSSAYRVWESRDLFISDLLEEAAEIFARQLSDRGALELTFRIVASRPDLHSTAEGRRRLILEVIRVVLEQNFYTTIDSVAWQSFLSLSAALLADRRSDAMTRVERILREGSDEFVAEMAAFHETVTRLLGFRLRDDFEGGYLLYAVLGSAIVEGLAVRHLSNPTVTDNFYLGHATLSDEPTEWAPAAIGFLAIFDQFMQPDPSFDPASIPEALSRIAPIPDGS